MGAFGEDVALIVTGTLTMARGLWEALTCRRILPGRDALRVRRGIPSTSDGRGGKFRKAVGLTLNL